MVTIKSKTRVLPLFILIIIHQVFSIGANLIIQPDGRVGLFQYRSIYISCRHSHEIVQRLYWLINGTEISAGYRMVEMIRDGDFFELVVPELTAEWNLTEIQCRAELLTGLSVTSAKSTLYIQGTLPAVGALSAIVKDTYLFLHWSPPFSQEVFGSTRILYNVAIENMTSLTLETSLTDLNIFILNVNSSRLLGCDTIRFIIQAHNPVGPGETSTITHMNTLPLESNHELVLNSNTNYDIIILLFSQICRISNLTVRNYNLNTNSSVTTNFTSLHSFGYTYRYRLDLDLWKGYNYNLSMIVQNSNGTAAMSFNISTHYITDVSVDSISSNMIRVQVHFDPLNPSSTGAFVTLLYCETIFCNSIDFTKSLYFSIFHYEARTYDVPYVTGYYLLYAYDTDVDGSIISSNNGSSYPIPGRRIFLFYNTTSGNVTSRGVHCNYNSSTTVVASNCNSPDVGFQQLLLYPINKNHASMLLVSNPAPLNETVCLQVDGEENYYAMTIQLKDTAEYLQPIGRSHIYMDNTNDFSEASCWRPIPTSSTTTAVLTNPTTSNVPADCATFPSSWTYVIAVIGTIGVTITIVIVTILVAKKIKKQEDIYTTVMLEIPILYEYGIDDVMKSNFPKTYESLNNVTTTYAKKEHYAKVLEWMEFADELICALPDKEIKISLMKELLYIKNTQKKTTLV